MAGLAHSDEVPQSSSSDSQTDMVDKMEDGAPAEEWGYVDVRQGAHMFWWLYRTLHPVGHRHRPWVLWIQGGPGLSGTGLGNFTEVGPLDHNLKPRPSSWVEAASLVFVDNPVGTGFSYVDDGIEVARGLDEITEDLMSFIRQFLDQHVVFKTQPLFIFGQSYGGKMAAHLACALSKASVTGDIDVNLKGVGLGNAFISPQHFLVSMGDILHQMSMIDRQAHKRVMESCSAFESALDDGSCPDVIEDRFYDVCDIITENSDGGHHDFYNVMDLEKGAQRPNKVSLPIRPERHLYFSIYELELQSLMDGSVRQKLGVIPQHVKWGANSEAVFQAQCKSDMFHGSVDSVDWLLNNTDVQVVIYEGQLDVACPPSGAEAWVDTLTWQGLKDYQGSRRTAILDPNDHQLDMFVKAHRQFKFYWVTRSGHAVPADRPATGLRLLTRIIDNLDV